MTRTFLVGILSLAIAVGFVPQAVAKKGSSGGHSGSGGGHSSGFDDSGKHRGSHSGFDDSGHHGGALTVGGGLVFNASGQHHHGNGLFGHNHGDGNNEHRHGELESGRHGAGEVEIHHSGGHD